MHSFNFVIFGSDDDFYRAAYCDIMNLTHVRYIGGPMQCKSKLLNTLYRFHTTPRINKHFSLPLKRIYNRLYFKSDFKDDLPLCFVFFGYSRGKILDWGYYNYIKKHFPNSRLVCFFQDLISINADLNLDRFRRYFDLILSFDHADAQKCDFIYYPLVYSSKCPFNISFEYPKSDVFFVGKAKNRLAEIISAYEKLSESGLICDFHITEAKPDFRPYRDQIDYCDHMPYGEYLCRLKAADCLLELLQHGGNGYTLRTNEAIAYNKKLLSNNSELRKAPFYNSSYISVFDNSDDIDMNFMKVSAIDLDYGYIKQLSPIALLKFIDDKLTNKSGIEVCLLKCYPTAIDEVKIIESQVFFDSRGWLMVPWNNTALKELGIDANFVQDTHSYTALKGTIRGLHFQNGEAAQAKLVRVLKGSVLDVAVDLRRGSPHYLQWVSAELSSENRRMLYIPRGFAHGFLTLSDDTEFFYKVDNAYNPGAERAVRFDDPQIGIEWGIELPIVSDKDKNAQLLSELDYSFRYPL